MYVYMNKMSSKLDTYNIIHHIPEQLVLIVICQNNKMPTWEQQNINMGVAKMYEKVVHL